MSAKPHLGRFHDDIVRLASDKVPATGIARVLGCCVSGVRKYCARNDIALVNAKDRYDEAAFRKALEQTRVATVLAAMFGVTTTSIRKWAAQCDAHLEDPYRAGVVITHNGYRLIYAKNHPNANTKGYVQEHVLVMEAHIGRHLRSEECVHHRDRNKLNNDIENLELMTLREHAALHAREGDTGWAVYHAKRNKI